MADQLGIDTETVEITSMVDAILAETDGVVTFEDIVEGETLKYEQDPGSPKRRKVIMEHKGDLHPQLAVKDDEGKPLAWYSIPEKAHIEVDDGTRIIAGVLLAKTARAITGTQEEQILWAKKGIEAAEQGAGAAGLVAGAPAGGAHDEGAAAGLETDVDVGPGKRR